MKINVFILSPSTNVRHTKQEVKAKVKQVVLEIKLIQILHDSWKSSNDLDLKSSRKDHIIDTQSTNSH